MFETSHLLDLIAIVKIRQMASLDQDKINVRTLLQTIDLLKEVSQNG